MNSRAPDSGRWWLWTAVLLTVFKLWLTRGQPVYAIGAAGHDERLFLSLAESILQGNWLGDYDQMTLAKGSFYSLWVAAVFWVGLPLAFAQQLAYAASCAAMVRAFGPFLRGGFARLGLYTLLLWNPMSFEAPTLGRVLRQNIYTPLTVLIFAGLVALFFRRQESFRRQAPWAALLGLALGGFWLTREESIWIAPSVVLLAAAAVHGALRDSPGAVSILGRSVLVAVACAMLPVGLVAWQNYRHYGWFGTVESRAAAFQDAYGAMVRVKIGPEIPFVPVTRQAREAMYAVSPAFAELRPHLEGPIGLGWSESSEYVTKQPPADRQIGGGWLMWALRDAVKAAGYCHSAAEALGFYRRLADEINQACDDGRLPAGPRRSGFLPVWRDGQTAAVARTLADFADFFVTFKGFGAYSPPSVGGDDVLNLFRDVTLDRLAPSEDATNFPLPNQTALNERKLALLQGIGRLLRPVVLVLFGLAQIVSFGRFIQLAWRRELTYLLVLAAAAWGACLAYLLINALVHATSFPLLAVSSFAPAYPLLLLFIAAALADGWMAWVQPRLAGRVV